MKKMWVVFVDTATADFIDLGPGAESMYSI